MAINDKSTPPAIRNLRMTMNVVILCLLALAISEFTIMNGSFGDINANFNLIENSYGRISEVQRISQDVRSLIMIQEKKLTNFLNRTTNHTHYPDFLFQDIEDSLNNLYSL